MKALLNPLLGTPESPRALRYALRYARRAPPIWANYWADFRRFMRHSGTLGAERQRDTLQASLTAAYHNIEKGLSLPQPRLRFGAAHLAMLIRLLRQWGDFSAPIARAAIDTLGAYAGWHRAQGVEDFPHRAAIDALLVDANHGAAPAIGGLRPLSKADVHAAALVPEDFFLQRHSIRQFTPDPVAAEDIDAAIRIAQKAPVVCNRQSGHIHVLTDPALVQRVLEFQGGARGFTDQIGTLMVVSTHLANFWNAGERNQPFVDGGLFAMSLILGLHSRGLGTCCLNWSRTEADSATLRGIVGMADDEAIIMLIAVGNLRDEFNVPFSNRKDPLIVSRVLSAPGQ